MLTQDTMEFSGQLRLIVCDAVAEVQQDFGVSDTDARAMLARALASVLVREVIAEQLAFYANGDELLDR